MSFWNKLTRKLTFPAKDKNQKSFTEKDNLGTRLDTLSLASSFWVPYITKQVPVVAYTFETEKDAR